MIKWKKMFETQISMLDTQHQELFEMLNKLVDILEEGRVNIDTLDTSIDELFIFAQKHFHDEEKIMNKYNLDASFLSLHKMEHHSFIYDITNMRGSLISDDVLIEKVEQLISFIASWLIVHALKTDQIMASQIRAVTDGMDPLEAYNKSKNYNPPAEVSQMMVNSLVHLWGHSKQKIQDLENEIESMKLK